VCSRTIFRKWSKWCHLSKNHRTCNPSCDTIVHSLQSSVKPKSSDTSKQSFQGLLKESRKQLFCLLGIMSPQIRLLLLAATSFGLTCSSVFGPTSHWLRKPNSDETDKTLKFATMLRLRGGEEAKKEGTDKIKGCCIGIDLGTTYRYERCQNVTSLTILHYFPHFQCTIIRHQLCCRLEKRES
jgi:hypothetical protein